MKNSKLRNKDLIGMHSRGGKGSHGGNKKQKNKQERKSIRKSLAKREYE